MTALTALLLLQAASAPEPAQPPAQPSAQANTQGTIVVTGERLGDLRRRLADCLARNCPPDEDVNATLAVAEAEFLNGDSNAAAQAIGASIRRNRRQAGAYPEPVADLYRSSARVFGHMGRDTQATSATREILSALREGIPNEDHRHFTARLEMVALLIRQGDYHGARLGLAELRDRAAAAGRQDVARMASMRIMILDDQAYPMGQPRRRLVALAESQDPAQRFESVAARTYLAGQYRRAGDTARADALLAGLPRPQGDYRELLFAPAFNLGPGEPRPPSGSAAGGSTTQRMVTVHAEQWVDVGYWIGADGLVTDVEVVRHGISPGWAAPLLTSIRGRRYTTSSDGTASYRLERFTLTSPLEMQTGSRIAQRSPRTRLEVMDLTAPDEPGREAPRTVAPGSAAPTN